MIDVLVVLGFVAGGWLFGRMLGVLLAILLERVTRRRGDECVDAAFDSVPRESCVERADVDRIFDDMTTELPDLRGRPAQLSAFYLPGKEEHG